MNVINVLELVGASTGVAKTQPLPLSSGQAVRYEKQVGGGPVDSQSTTSQGSEAKEPLTSSKVEAAVSELNTHLQLAGRSLRFQIHEDPTQIVVSVIDDETGETIRQIPPEVTVKLAEAGQDLRGLLTNVQG